jgi:hypothetical protein
VEIKVFASGLWVIVLEMCVAFGLAVFIVWWTWPRKKAQPPSAAGEDKNGKQQDRTPR